MKARREKVGCAIGQHDLPEPKSSPWMYASCRRCGQRFKTVNSLGIPCTAPYIGENERHWVSEETPVPEDVARVLDAFIGGANAAMREGDLEHVYGRGKEAALRCQSTK